MIHPYRDFHIPTGSLICRTIAVSDRCNHRGHHYGTLSFLSGVTILLPGTRVVKQYVPVSSSQYMVAGNILECL
ncbi:uncharacterized protein YALI1_D06434g [Yarrowia lipolytica]|uniref:Uncharacterized protein n=1 Tax=Yarrowia lipolytica TaxID=4952 RepID=A0A1D8ND89_YARLL|nr:hypothetical protein YALI1_D06434g [Yarrowia lipolytica]